MRYILTVDFESPKDIQAILEFLQFHANRLRCEEKDVFIKLADEWKKATIDNVSSSKQDTGKTGAETKKKARRAGSQAKV